MADPQALSRLISVGDYWAALELKPGASNTDINWRVTELREEHPGLGSALNQVKTTLTQRREAYERACAERDRVARQIEAKYGPEILRMEATGGDPPRTLRADLWRGLEASLLDAPGSAASVGSDGFVDRFLGQVEALVARLPGMEISTGELNQGRAERTVGYSEGSGTQQTASATFEVPRGVARGFVICGRMGADRRKIYARVTAVTAYVPGGPHPLTPELLELLRQTRQPSPGQLGPYARSLGRDLRRTVPPPPPTVWDGLRAWRNRLALEMTRRNLGAPLALLLIGALILGVYLLRQPHARSAPGATSTAAPLLQVTAAPLVAATLPLPSLTNTPTSAPTPIVTPSPVAPSLPGSAGADGVIAFSPGPGAQRRYGDAKALLGGPDGVYTPGYEGIVQLGRGGSVVLAFTDNAIIDGPGPDLQIYGEPANDDSLLVEVSAGDEPWRAFPIVPESSAPLDLADLGLAYAVYVRLTDAQPGTATGAEVDAVVALHSGPATHPLPAPPATPTPTHAPVATPAATRMPVATRTPGPTRTPRSTATPAATWVLFGDSFAEYPGQPTGLKWSYLFTVGRPNFRWQDMAWDEACWCYKDDHNWNLRIGQDYIKTDGRGDVGVQWKNSEGGTFRVEWDAKSLAFYRQLYVTDSEGPGSRLPYSVVLRDIDEWSIFFWVATADTQYHILIFKLVQP